MLTSSTILQLSNILPINDKDNQLSFAAASNSFFHGNTTGTQVMCACGVWVILMAFSECILK
jgi:hypothetical protein